MPKGLLSFSSHNDINEIKTEWTELDRKAEENGVRYVEYTYYQTYEWNEFLFHHTTRGLRQVCLCDALPSGETRRQTVRHHTHTGDTTVEEGEDSLMQSGGSAQHLLPLHRGVGRGDDGCHRRIYRDGTQGDEDQLCRCAYGGSLRRRDEENWRRTEGAHELSCAARRI